MKPNQQGINAVMEIASSDLDHQLSPVQLERKDELISILQNYLNCSWTFEQSLQGFLKLGIPTDVLDRMREIKNVEEAPLRSSDDQNDDFNHKKSRPWSPIEDTRLLAGIIRYGLENWSTVAMFVGNDRTRAQCSQRWSRGLNPRISKDTWSTEEENLLIQLVQQYGDKSWTKISSMLGNRSDVQCRYHFHQISKNQSNSFSSAPNPVPNMQFRNLEQISSHPNVRQTPRFSLPNVALSPLNTQKLPQPQIQQPQIQQPQNQQQFVNCSPLGFRPLYTGLMAPPAPIPPPPIVMNGQMNYNPGPSFNYYDNGADNSVDCESFIETDNYAPGNNFINNSSNVSQLSFPPPKFNAPFRNGPNPINQPNRRFASPSQIASIPNSPTDMDEINIDGFLQRFK